MTGADFTQWLAAMKTAGLANTDAECGRIIGLTKNSVVRSKRRPHIARYMALACAAALAGIRPYGSDE